MRNNINNGRGDTDADWWGAWGHLLVGRNFPSGLNDLCFQSRPGRLGINFSGADEFRFIVPKGFVHCLQMHNEPTETFRILRSDF